MKKLVWENIEEIRENYFDEPEERVSPEERDNLYKVGKEGFEGKQTFTKEELIFLLEDLYMEVAGSYNDYGKWPEDYRETANTDVKNFLTKRGL
jgi:hypothetical protein